jgi:ribose 1,5-bisphosphokinase
MSHSARLFFLVGPSGVGKDTLLNHLKQHQYSDNQPLVAHRYITRPVREGDENHISLSEFDFNQRKEAGLFLFDWESHGFQYAIGKEARKWVKQGQNVIVNGSRRYLPKALNIYAKTTPIWITVSEDILRERLTQRGRETAEEIELRIQRNRELESMKMDNCIYINNDQSVEDTVGQIIALIEMNDI